MTVWQWTNLHQTSETEATKWHPAIIDFITHTCAFPTVKRWNVLNENSPSLVANRITMETALLDLKTHPVQNGNICEFNRQHHCQIMSHWYTSSWPSNCNYLSSQYLLNRMTQRLFPLFKTKTTCGPEEMGSTPGNQLSTFTLSWDIDEQSPPLI